MIHPYDNKTQTRWNRGEFKVQLMLPSSDRPMGFCDGSDEDMAELQARSEAEGAEGFSVRKRVLKTGREIWTLGGS